MINLKDKRGFVENWGIFFLLFAVGFIVMLLMLKVWSKMDYEVSFVTKMIILIVVPVIVAFFFTKRLENG